MGLAILITHLIYTFFIFIVLKFILMPLLKIQFKEMNKYTFNFLFVFLLIIPPYGDILLQKTIKTGYQIYFSIENPVYTKNFDMSKKIESIDISDTDNQKRSIESFIINKKILKENNTFQNFDISFFSSDKFLNMTKFNTTISEFIELSVSDQNKTYKKVRINFNKKPKFEYFVKSKSRYKSYLKKSKISSILNINMYEYQIFDNKNKEIVLKIKSVDFEKINNIIRDKLLYIFKPYEGWSLFKVKDLNFLINNNLFKYNQERIIFYNKK